MNDLPMRVRVKHCTRYEYSEPVALGPHLIRLRPASHVRAEVLSYNLEVLPRCHLRWQHDPWGNRIARATFEAEERLDHLEVTVDLALDIRPVNPFDFYVDDRCERVPFAYPDGLAEELAPFLAVPPPNAALQAFIEEVPFEGYVVDYLVAFNAHVAKRVGYVIRTDPGIQTSIETLKKGRGSCRDSALLLVDSLRTRGLAARFVSGYLVQLADEGIIPDETKGVERDVVDLHAWAEVYLPGAGWVGIDGTSGLLAGEGHIPLASAVSPTLAAPVTGTASAPTTSFDFTMHVARLGHEPRPRRPYEPASWDAIVAAGAEVDATLSGAGLQLTCGGEPTFTSRLHPREPEWNTEAVGKTKRRQGQRLAAELGRRLAEGVLPLERMGKHYPGESLPRWSIELLWRDDGVPIWRDGSLLAFLGADQATGDDVVPRRERALVAAEVAGARRFGEHLARRLEVDPAGLQPAFEDPWHFVREEQRLPVDVDPLAADLDDGEERRRLAHVLDRGLTKEVGYVLPLAADGQRFRSTRWTFRRERLYLLPGDSPLGLRLPLEQLEGEELWPLDHTLPAPPLRFDPRQEKWQPAQAAPPLPPMPMRTAVCLEPRNGALYLFLPPLESAEAYLRLISAVEDVARELRQKVRIEGYPPPADARLRACLVTPDPGVLEVNLPVARSFADYVASMEVIADAANHADLSTEKYQIDGREVGSGGGNHITLGGPSTVESPFLLQPRLLGSLLRYLQHHPSLSYLFTGLFVGPTSQAPRVDEARHDALYELDLALSQLPQRGESVFPWLVDRLLRHLLVDVSGNTHRTELCIDKLYAPEGLSGRQGLVELRAFEMPPHVQMAGVQLLLVRALVARFTKQLYEAPLLRWGSQLHDRFMLPHFLWRDLCDVVADLQRHGIALEADWFLPFVDYRFPVLGRLVAEDVELELRTALEPWPTLGEQPVGAAVARYVDSSLERLQVRVTGLVEGRHRIAVNGLELPLFRTDRVDESVAGVRFRAWQPPNCLHPSIPVHHPLRFDVVDTWGQRSLGACTYHVWHPEGRAFDDPPLTAFEAAARRAQRFTREGHAPWPVRLEPTTPAAEQPLTLDLRRYRHG